MARLHKASKPCGGMEFDMSSVPDTCTQVEDVVYTETAPVNSVSDSPTLPVEFNGQVLSDSNCDLKGSKVYMQTQLLHADGTPLEAGEKVGPVNSFANAMFSQVEMSANDMLVSKNNAMHPFKAYFEIAYPFGTDAKHGILENEIYYQDECGDAFDQTGILVSPINNGFMNRAKLCEESKVMDMLWTPHLELFMQERMLVSNTTFRVKFVRSSSEFCLMAGTDKKYIVKILKAVLILRMVKLNKSVLIEQNHLLERGVKMVYPIRRVDMQTFIINSGVLSHSRSNLVNGILPGRILIALTSHKAFNGAYDRSPFRFRPYGVNKIHLICNGKSIPTRPYTPNFIDKDRSRHYGKGN